MRIVWVNCELLRLILLKQNPDGLKKVALDSVTKCLTNIKQSPAYPSIYFCKKVSLIHLSYTIILHVPWKCPI